MDDKDLTNIETEVLIKELHRRTDYDLTPLLRCNGCRELTHQEGHCNYCARRKHDYFVKEKVSHER